MQKKGSFYRWIYRKKFLQYNPEKRWEEKVRKFTLYIREKGIDSDWWKWENSLHKNKEKEVLPAVIHIVHRFVHRLIADDSGDFSTFAQRFPHAPMGQIETKLDSFR